MAQARRNTDRDCEMQIRLVSQMEKEIVIEAIYTEYRGQNTAFSVLTLQAVLSGGRGELEKERNQPPSHGAWRRWLMVNYQWWVEAHATAVRFNELNGLLFTRVASLPHTE
jgi:hypothetical protein